MKFYFIVFLALVWGINWLAAEYGNYPIIYCYMSGPASQIVAPWLWMANLASMVIFAGFLAMQRWTKAAMAAVVLILVFSLPMMGDTMFRLGKSCY